MHGRHFVEQVAELNGHLHGGDMRVILETQLLGGSIMSNLISPHFSNAFFGTQPCNSQEAGNAFLRNQGLVQ